MPMNTMFRIDACFSWVAAYHCPTISEAVRFRISPICAVSQNPQPSAHPTWLDTHSVVERSPVRTIIGMITDSISSGSAPAPSTRCTNLTVRPVSDSSDSSRTIGASPTTAGPAPRRPSRNTDR